MSACECSLLQPETMEWDPGGRLRTTIAAVVASLDRQDDMRDNEARTELDSHANMPVVGRNAYILSETGKMVDVSPFTPDYQSMAVQVVDAAIQYDDPYDGQSYILVIRNALSVPSMHNNLMPPFVLREAGIQVKDVPKIHVTAPTEEDHSIMFKETGFRIPMSLWGTFSYFPTSKPTNKTLQEPPDVYVLTPTTWNPHSDAYAFNEESMLDWEGNIKPPKDREKRIVVDELPDNDAMVSMLHIGERLHQYIDAAFCESDCDCVGNDVYSTLRHEAMVASLKIHAGTSNPHEITYLMDPETDDDSMSSNDMYDVEEDVPDLEGVDLDDYFSVSATQASKSRNIDPEHLSKVWRISHKEAQRTLDATSQKVLHREDTTLSRNYGTGDRMLRYRRIHTYFYMDTFFASKKKGKSTRGNTCCQLFVTDKGFIYVVPMRRKSDVPAAIKQFAKQVGAPDAIIADMAGEQMSDKVKQFCNDIGTTLRALEEGTPWANKAELYIGLLKEAVRKDMREADSPLVLWDYCVQRRALIHVFTAKDRFNLQATNPYTATFGNEGDISNLCQFAWYVH